MKMEFLEELKDGGVYGAMLSGILHCNINNILFNPQ